jgi:predicted nucleic acid-binding protein
MLARPCEVAMIVADTDVMIDYLRGFAPVADRVELELRHGLATTAVSAFELWTGSLGSNRRERAVEALLGAMRILPLDPASAKTGAAVRDLLRKRGRTASMADALIAGICIENAGILLTRNRAHFEGIDRLALGTLDPGPEKD